MNPDTQKIPPVPTNIITGFLGAGKTSAILHLLKYKPANERWAVLVNEFGEIGVDGSFFEGQHSEEQDVFIRELPGGCMCCSAGLPMHIALNQLLAIAKPNRLLIEPTGLGHPKEVLQALSTEHYREILDLQKILTLVDARKLSEERYTNHETFYQQIAIADTIVGNKVDLYQNGDEAKLQIYVKEYGAAQTQVVFTQNGELTFEHLIGKTAATAKGHYHNAVEEKPLLSEVPLPASGYIKATNKGEGFHSVGWRFSSSHVFSHEKIFSLLSGINAERMKAVFITEQGVFGYNLTHDALKEVELEDCKESRVEVISDDIKLELEAQLLGCISCREGFVL